MPAVAHHPLLDGPGRRERTGIEPLNHVGHLDRRPRLQVGQPILGHLEPVCGRPHLVDEQPRHRPAQSHRVGREPVEDIRIGLNENPNNTEFFQSFKFLWVNNIWQPDNGMVPVIMRGENFLAIKELPRLLFFKQNPEAFQTFQNLGFIIEDVKNIPQAAIDKYNELVQPLIAVYPGKSNGWFIWPLLAGATMFLSSWIMQKGQPRTTQTGGTGKFMVYVFPVMSFFSV